LASSHLVYIGLDPRGVTCRSAEGTLKPKSAKALKMSNKVINEVINTYL